MLIPGQVASAVVKKKKINKKLLTGQSFTHQNTSHESTFLQKLIPNESVQADSPFHFCLGRFKHLFLAFSEFFKFVLYVFVLKTHLTLFYLCVILHLIYKISCLLKEFYIYTQAHKNIYIISKQTTQTSHI